MGDIQLCPDMDAGECFSAIGCDSEYYADVVAEGVAITLADPNLAEDPETAIAYWAGGCKVIVDCMVDEDACDEDTVAAIAANDDPENGLCQDGDDEEAKGQDAAEDDGAEEEGRGGDEGRGSEDASQSSEALSYGPTCHSDVLPK